MVERRVTHRWMGASSHQFGSTESSTRGYSTPPYMFLAPGNGPRSMRSTERPARARARAAAEPAGPAPTTMASTSLMDGPRGELVCQRDEYRVCVVHDRHIGLLSH